MIIINTLVEKPQLPNLCIRCGLMKPLEHEVQTLLVGGKVLLDQKVTATGIQYKHINKQFKLPFHLCNECHAQYELVKPIVRRNEIIAIVFTVISGLATVLAYPLLFNTEQRFTSIGMSIGCGIIFAFFFYAFLGQLIKKYGLEFWKAPEMVDNKMEWLIPSFVSANTQMSNRRYASSVTYQFQNIIYAQEFEQLNADIVHQHLNPSNEV